MSGSEFEPVDFLELPVRQAEAGSACTPICGSGASILPYFSTSQDPRHDRIGASQSNFDFGCIRSLLTSKQPLTACSAQLNSTIRQNAQLQASSRYCK